MGSDERDRQRNCALVRVPWYEVPNYWPIVGEWVGDALRRGYCLHYTLEGVYNACLEGRMTLWLVQDDKIRGCAITQINQNLYRVCELFAVGGLDVRRWLALEKEVARYARDMGCDFVEGSGRKGWGRLMPDYEEVYTVYRKEL